MLPGHTGRVNIIDTRANLVAVTVLLESTEQFHVTLGSLNRNNVCVQSLDRREDVVEVGVTEVRVGLSVILNTSSGQAERVNCPGEVTFPIASAKRELQNKVRRVYESANGITYTFTNSGFVDLDGVDTSFFEINDFITEGKSKLLRLNLARDVNTRE